MFHFYIPENFGKTEAFWRFLGVKKWKIGLKWVNNWSYERNSFTFRSYQNQTGLSPMFRLYTHCISSPPFLLGRQLSVPHFEKGKGARKKINDWGDLKSSCQRYLLKDLLCFFCQKNFVKAQFQIFILVSFGNNQLILF